MGVAPPKCLEHFATDDRAKVAAPQQCLCALIYANRQELLILIEHVDLSARDGAPDRNSSNGEVEVAGNCESSAKGGPSMGP